ncbi:MAG: hypothetical protein JSR82_13565 [Verrucomicrobia bacterium]|nr:hypothetical protein [Verrucomicrobiota bacterium]
MIELQDRDTGTVLTPTRKRVLAALGAAVLIHGILLLCLASLAPLMPAPRPFAVVTPKPLKLTIERPDETPAAAPEEKKKLDYIETNPNRESDKPPEKADFESDKDTLAATERPEDSKGDKPLPTQDGREIPYFHFETRPYTPGEKAANIASKPAAASAAQPGPTPPPPPSEVQTTPPRPQPNLTATPPPNVGPRDIAVLPPTTPLPSSPTPPPDRNALLRPMQPETRPSIPSVFSPGRQTTQGYQSETEKTKMVGGLSNRGESSVSAIGTPLGRYQKAISDAIGNRWYFYANRRSDLAAVGTVHTSFLITRSGKVERVRVTSNTSNQTVASFSVQAIVEARIPPMPPEVASIIPAEGMSIDYSFAIY